jgi:hypothetical protein
LYRTEDRKQKHFKIYQQKKNCIENSYKYNKNI